MINPSQKLSEWRAWLNVVNTEIVGLAHNRRIFRDIMALIEANPDLPSSSVVYEWMTNTYVVSALAAVRRQRDARVISLRRLMEDMLRNPQEITRSWFVAQYGGQPWADRDFDRFAPDGSEHLDVSQIDADLALLDQTGKAIRTFTNRYVAHRDEQIALGRVAAPPLLTWQELDAAIDLLSVLLRRYELLLNQRGMLDVEPVIQEDWESVFDIPWRTLKSTS